MVNKNGKKTTPSTFLTPKTHPKKLRECTVNSRHFVLVDFNFQGHPPTWSNATKSTRVHWSEDDRFLYQREKKRKLPTDLGLISVVRGKCVYAFSLKCDWMCVIGGCFSLMNILLESVLMFISDGFSNICFEVASPGRCVIALLKHKRSVTHCYKLGGYMIIWIGWLSLYFSNPFHLRLNKNDVKFGVYIYIYRYN